jgi:hypothetical protein
MIHLIEIESLGAATRAALESQIVEQLLDADDEARSGYCLDLLLEVYNHAGSEARPAWVESTGLSDFSIWATVDPASTAGAYVQGTIDASNAGSVARKAGLSGEQALALAALVERSGPVRLETSGDGSVSGADFDALSELGDALVDKLAAWTWEVNDRLTSEAFERFDRIVEEARKDRAAAMVDDCLALRFDDGDNSVALFESLDQDPSESIEAEGALPAMLMADYEAQELSRAVGPIEFEGAYSHTRI